MKKRSGKSAAPLVAVRFEFHIRIYELRPWLRMTSPLVLQWHRGDKRGGLSSAVWPVPDVENPNGYMAIIDADFRVPGTLYREKGMPGAPYQKKTVVMSLHEAVSESDPQPKPTALGKLNINLSDFADKGEVTDLSVPVHVSSALLSALGSSASPSLHVTMQCVGKKLSKEAAAEEKHRASDSPHLAGFHRPFGSRLEAITDSEDPDPAASTEGEGATPRGSAANVRQHSRGGSYAGPYGATAGQDGREEDEEEDGEGAGGRGDGRSSHGDARSTSDGAGGAGEQDLYTGEGVGGAREYEEELYGEEAQPQAAEAHSAPLQHPGAHKPPSIPISSSTRYQRPAADVPKPPLPSSGSVPAPSLAASPSRLLRPPHLRQASESEPDALQPLAAQGSTDFGELFRRISSSKGGLAGPIATPERSSNLGLGGGGSSSGTAQAEEGSKGLTSYQRKAHTVGRLLSPRSVEGSATGRPPGLPVVTRKTLSASRADQEAGGGEERHSDRGSNTSGEGARVYDDEGPTTGGGGGKGGGMSGAAVQSHTWRGGHPGQETQSPPLMGVGGGHVAGGGLLNGVPGAGRWGDAGALHEEEGRMGGHAADASGMHALHDVDLDSPDRSALGQPDEQRHADENGMTPRQAAASAALARQAEAVEEERRQVEALRAEVQRMQLAVQREKRRVEEERERLAVRLRCLDNPSSSQALFQQWADQQEARLQAERSSLWQLQEQLEERSAEAEAQAQAVAAAKRLLQRDQQGLEDVTASVADALAQAARAEEKARTAEQEMCGLPSELRDAALVEVAVFGVPPTHGLSVQATHAPARRLARAYAHAWWREGRERAAGVARAAVVALTLVCRTSMGDASRLLFWWSNLVFFREALSAVTRAPPNSADDDSSDTPQSLPPLPSPLPAHSLNSMAATMDASPDITPPGRPRGGFNPPTPGLDDRGRESWESVRLLQRLLRTLEEWAHSRCVQLLWHEAFLPAMQSPQHSAAAGTPSVPVTPRLSASGAPSHIASPPAASTSSSGSSPPVSFNPSAASPPPPNPAAAAAGALFSAFAPPSSGQPPSAGQLLSGLASWAKSAAEATLAGPAGAAAGAGAAAEVEEAQPKAVLFDSDAAAVAASPWQHLAGQDRWRAVLQAAAKQLCPMRGAGKACGCLYPLHKQVLEQCLLRLDTALFNALLRNSDLTTEPLVDVVSDPMALPVPATGSLTYGDGLELKFATSSWLSVLQEMDLRMQADVDEAANATLSFDPSSSSSAILSSGNPRLPKLSSFRKASMLLTQRRHTGERGAPPPAASAGAAGGGVFSAAAFPRAASTAGSVRKADASAALPPSRSIAAAAPPPPSTVLPPHAALMPGLAAGLVGGAAEVFPLLKSLAQALLLPKELLRDRETRADVCGDLGPTLLCRVLFLFAPDSNAPEHVPPSLLSDLSQEMPRSPLTHFRLSAGDYTIPPPTRYRPPSSHVVHAMLGNLPCFSQSPSQADTRGFSDTSAGGTGLVLEPGYGSDEELQSLESPLTLLAGLVGRAQSLGPSQVTGDREAMVRAAVSRRLVYRRKGVQMLQEVWDEDKRGTGAAAGMP